MQATTRQRVLIIPGYGDSGPQHWQTVWEETQAGIRRVVQQDWLTPQCDDWVRELDKAVAVAGPDVLLAAHSMGCLLVAHWAARTRLTIRGALLVAVPDCDGPSFPQGTAGFSPVPMTRLPFPTTVVASDNDVYADIAYARRCAQAWGSRFVDLGPAGHINADSGYGAWPEGLALLHALRTAN